MLGVLLATIVAGAAAGPAEEPGEAPRISLDLVETDIAEIVGALATVGGYQAVLNDVPSCRPTLRVTEAAWDDVLEHVLGACRLAAEAQGRVLWVTQASAASERVSQERQLAQRREPGAGARTRTIVALSYASAVELAATLRSQLPDDVEVVADARTNTLIVVGPR